MVVSAQTGRLGLSALRIAFCGLALLCALVLWIGVIWASGRGFDITDESYYILSAKRPQDILMYVSAQHWTIAPLWSLTQDVQAFRLLGAFILSLSATVLAVGSVRMSDYLGILKADRTTVLATVAAGTVGALLYVSTIAPSPSYNLLAASGAAAGLGFALLAACQSRLRLALFYAAVAGVALAIGFLNKPSAGVSTAFLSGTALLV